MICRIIKKIIVFIFVILFVACSDKNFYVLNKTTSSNINIDADVGEDVDEDEIELVDKIFIVGDIYYSKRFCKQYDAYGIQGNLDETYMSYLENSDLNIGNLECALTDEIEDDKQEKTFNLFMLPSYTKALSDAHFHVLTLANNHILDYGKAGLFKTMQQLTLNDISFVGAGANIDEASAPIIKIINGRKYAIIAASTVIPNGTWQAKIDNAGVFSGYNPENVCSKIDEIKNVVDKVIVYMHWGNELETVSQYYQQSLAKKFVLQGADLVVGAHPHVLQEIEFYNDVPIIYSLGNFIFGTTPKDTMGLYAEFDYTENEKGLLNIKIVPGLSNYETVTAYKNEWELKPFYETLQLKSRNCIILDDGHIVENVN